MRDFTDVRQIFHAEWIFLFAQKSGDGIVETFRVQAIDLSGVHAQRAVHKDGHFGQLAVASELMERVNNLLRAADGKRGDDDFAFFVNRLAHEPADLFVGALLG